MSMDEFEEQLRAAYKAWHESRGRTPDRFFALYADDIELHSVLEASIIDDPARGPFVGKRAAIAYFAAVAEAWEMVDACTDDFLARGDKIVWIGHATWRNLRTLRLVSGPKVDVWTVRDGRAVRFLELFDSYGFAHAIGAIDPPASE
jgi:uncharacterized protein